MADSMIQNLLKTPRQIREEQLQKMRNEAAGRAQLGGVMRGTQSGLPGIFSSVLQQQRPALATDIAQTARGLTQGLGGMLGAAGYQQAGQALAQATVTPEERQAAQAQSVMKGLDINDPAALKAAADELTKLGLTGAATRLSERAEMIVDRLRTRGFESSREARAASEEARAIAEEERKVAEEFRRQGKSEREIQDWMENNKDRLLKRVRETQKARREEQTASRIESARQSALAIAGDKEALTSLGINPKLADRIVSAKNKDAYIELISERMKAYGEDPTGGSLPTAQQNLAKMTDLIEQRRNAQLEGNNPLAQQLGTQITVLGGILGLNSSKFEGVIVDSLEAQQQASALDTKASNLIAKIDSVKLDMKSGVPARADEALKTIFGAEDPITVLRTEYNNIRNSSVLQYLPPGVASDRDVALVLEGTLPSTSDPEAMMSFLRGVQKVAAAERQYHQERLNYLSEPTRFGNPAGFVAEYENKQRTARKQQLLDLGYDDNLATKYSETPLAFSKAVQAKSTSGSRLDSLETRLKGL